MLLPSPARVTIDHPEGAVRISVAFRNWLMVAYAAAVSVYFFFYDSSSAFERAVFSLFVVVFIALCLAARVEIIVDGRSFTIRRALGPLGFSRSYDLRQIRGLRAEDPGLRRGLYRFLGPNTGPRPTIAFEVGAETQRFGSGLDEDQVTEVVNALQEAISAAGPVQMPSA